MQEGEAAFGIGINRANQKILGKFYFYEPIYLTGAYPQYLRVHERATIFLTGNFVRLSKLKCRIELLDGELETLD